MLADIGDNDVDFAGAHIIPQRIRNLSILSNHPRGDIVDDLRHGALVALGESFWSDPRPVGRDLVHAAERDDGRAIGLSRKRNCLGADRCKDTAIR